MSLWFLLALMTAAAVFAVLWPLGRAPRLRAGGESAIYKDQLAEVERDRTAGLISAADAEAAKIEISRRLLASARSEHGAPAAAHLKVRRAVAVFALLGLPLMSGALYLAYGSPTLGGFPLAARPVVPPAHGVAGNARCPGRSASGEKSEGRPRLGGSGARAAQARPLGRRGSRLPQFGRIQRRDRRAAR